MENVKYRIPFILFVSTLAAALVLMIVSLGGTASLSGTAYADVTSPDEINVILDEAKSKESGAAVAYALPASVDYGSGFALPTPRLKYEGEPAAKIVASVSIDGKEIAGGLEFSEVSYYINKYMPSGEYTLTLSADGVTQSDGKADWWTADADDPAVTTSKDYTPISVSYEFVVNKAAFPSEFSSRILDSFNGEVRYIYDGQMHFLPEDNVIAEVEKEGIYDRGKNNYWASSAADEYFGGFTVTYNFTGGADSAHYHTAEYFSGDDPDPDCKSAVPVEPGKYRVHYNVSSQNYADINASGAECMFRAAIVREVELPVLTAEYNGEMQTAAIAENPYYTVVKNEGGENVGTYDVVLRLSNPEFYIWQGQAFDESTAEITVGFEITKAQNGWVVLPSVDRWTEGEYSAAENAVVGSARFGEVNIIITDENDNVLFNRLANVNKLAEAKAGVYTLTAYVSESDNWHGISGEYAYSKTIRVYPKPGMAWWAILLIVIAAVAVVALVFFLLDRLGILRVMSKKHVLKMRLDANMDATLAAMRFAKGRSEQSDGENAEPDDGQADTTEQADDPAPAPEQAESDISDFDADVQSVSQGDDSDATDDTAEAEQAQQTVEQDSAPETTVEPVRAKDDAQYLTEEMIQDYIYGMAASERAAAAFTAEQTSDDGIIVATTFDKKGDK